MRKLLGLLVLSVCILSGCTGTVSQDSSDVQQESVVYQALPLPEVYLEIPETYTATSSQFYEEYYVREDASIIITEDTNGPFDSVYDYAIAALVKYQDVTEQLDLLNEEIVYAGSLSVQLLEFTYTIGEGTDALTKTTMVGYFTDASSMYIVTCKSDVETYDNYRSDFLQVIQSAVLIK